MARDGCDEEHVYGRVGYVEQPVHKRAARQDVRAGGLARPATVAEAQNLVMSLGGHDLEAKFALGTAPVGANGAVVRPLDMRGVQQVFQEVVERERKVPHERLGEEHITSAELGWQRQCGVVSHEAITPPEKDEPPRGLDGGVGAHVCAVRLRGVDGHVGDVSACADAGEAPAVVGTLEEGLLLAVCGRARDEPALGEGGGAMRTGVVERDELARGEVAEEDEGPAEEAEWLDIVVAYVLGPCNGVPLIIPGEGCFIGGVDTRRRRGDMLMVG